MTGLGRQDYKINRISCWELQVTGSLESKLLDFKILQILSSCLPSDPYLQLRNLLQVDQCLQFQATSGPVLYGVGVYFFLVSQSHGLLGFWSLVN
jgi:hypothetical protein